LTVAGLLSLANLVMAVVNVILALVLSRLVVVGRRFNATLADYVSGHGAADSASAPAQAIPPAVPSPVAAPPLAAE
jgi:hypothetical protein